MKDGPTPPLDDALLVLAVLARRLEVMTGAPTFITEDEMREIDRSWQVGILYSPDRRRYTVEVREAPQTIDAEPASG